jgi:hypothetical protein
LGDDLGLFLVDPAAVGLTGHHQKRRIGMMAPVLGSVARQTMTISFIAVLYRPCLSTAQ